MIVCCFGSLFSRRGLFITTFFNKFRLSILFDKIRKYSTLFDIIRQHSTKFCNFRHYSTSLQHNAINILPLNFVAGFALSRGPVWEWGEGLLNRYLNIIFVLFLGIFLNRFWVMNIKTLSSLLQVRIFMDLPSFRYFDWLLFPVIIFSQYIYFFIFEIIPV